MRPFEFDHYAPGSRGPFQVQDPVTTTTWRFLVLLRNLGFTPTSPSETTTEFLDSPSQTRSGQSGPGNVTVDINRTPTLKSYRICKEAFDKGGQLTFRDWGGEPVVESGGTAQFQVTTAGVATLTVLTDAGTPTDPALKYTPGRVIYQNGAVGDVAYTIEAVLSSSSLQVSRLGLVTTAAAAGQPAIVTPDDEAIAAVAPGDKHTFMISRPGTLREFTGRVTSLGGYTRGAGNDGQVDQMVVNVLQRPDDLIVLAPQTD